MIRRMINTSEDVEMTRRLEIVDDYGQKLLNSEYSLKEARDVIVGGLKGYERLLSLSLDKTSPRWKPLHVPGSWNASNRRMAKQKSRSSWFKGKKQEEVVTRSAGREGA
jgi:hypothetical protein